MKILITLLTFSFLSFSLTTEKVEVNTLTTDEGLTLYVFDKDEEGVSNCNGGCANVWPPLLRKDAHIQNNELGVIKRSDGTEQITLNGRPLYLFHKDIKPGDIKGDGLGGVWHIITSPKLK